MKLIKNASAEKLRGGFYTPEPIAAFILKWGINGNSDYNISSGYGGYAGSDFNTGWGSLLGTNTNGKSGYIGG